MGSILEPEIAISAINACVLVLLGRARGSFVSGVVLEPGMIIFAINACVLVLFASPKWVKMNAQRDREVLQRLTARAGDLGQGSVHGTDHAVPHVGVYLGRIFLPTTPTQNNYHTQA